MLAGSDGPGGIYFDDHALAQSIGVIALIVILYSGGLDTNWCHVRNVLREGISLATVGVLLTTTLACLFAHYALGFPLLESFLLGSIISSTDAAAVFSILRSRGVSLKGKISPLLELESGSNDPMAIFLTISAIKLIGDNNPALGQILPSFFFQMLVGGLIGFLTARAGLFFINRLKLGYEGLYPVLCFGLIFLCYSVTNLLGGSGFLAVYIAGLTMGREEFLHKRSLLRFYDSLAWLMQIVMFLTLGLLVFPSHLVTVILPGLALAIFLMLVARPLSVLISLLRSRFGLQEKIFISWVGLRGAVPIVLATYPKLAGVPGSDFFFNMVFFVVLTSVLLQGTSIPLAAKWLKVSAPRREKQLYPIENIEGQGWKSTLIETRVPPFSWAIGRAIYQLGLPMDYLIVLIKRGDDFIVPNGSIVIQKNDILLGLAEPEIHKKVEELLNSAPPHVISTEPIQYD